MLRDDIDSSSAEGAGRLLYEPVHYVQERSDNFLNVNECNRFTHEKEAYDLQKTYLIEHGIYPTFVIYLAPPPGCSVAVREFSPSFKSLGADGRRIVDRYR